MMNELSLIEEQSLKATRFAHGLLLTVCLAAFVFSFSPSEESVYNKAVKELNALLSLNLSKLQLNGAKKNKKIDAYINEVNLVLKEYGFSFSADGVKGSIFEILPQPPYSLEELALEEIYNYINNLNLLSVSLVKLNSFENDLRRDFSKNGQRYAQYATAVKMYNRESNIGLAFGNTHTGFELEKTITDRQIIKYEIPFDPLTEISKDLELSPLVTKYNDTFILMDSLKRVWDQVRPERPIQARTILARKDIPQDRRLEVFGLSIQQKLISWVIPLLVFAFGINLLTHVLHLKALANKNSKILRYPWIGIMPGKLPKYVSAVTIIVFPFLSLICIGKFLLIQERLYVQITAAVFSVASVTCLIFVYFIMEKMKTNCDNIDKDIKN